MFINGRGRERMANSDSRTDEESASVTMYRRTAAVVALCVAGVLAQLEQHVIEQEWLKADSSHRPLHRHTRDAACGGSFNHETEQKVVTSPNYPHDYHNSMNCFYSIEAPPGHYVEISFEDFRIEIPRTSSSNCTYDGLTVRDGSKYGEPMGRYCGKLIPSDFQSRTNIVLLHLYSDESLGFRGFKLHYRILCGATFFSEHGTLLFNENDEHISATNSCDFELVARPHQYLDLNFTINGLTLTETKVFDHGDIMRTLKKDYDYSDMDVRAVSTSNIARVRFSYSGVGEGSAVIAYQAHPRKIVSGSHIFLFHTETCKGLTTPPSIIQGTRLITASNTTKDAVLHRIERVGGHPNDTINSGDEVYLRTMTGGTRPFSLSAGRDGNAGYDDTAHGNSTWRIYGELQHGGRVWLENKQYATQYLGMYGRANAAGTAPRVTMNVGLCSSEVDWVVFKSPLDFGWDKYQSKGKYQARWVDGLPVAVYKTCMKHPVIFPYCGGSPRPQCPGTR